MSDAPIRAAVVVAGPGDAERRVAGVPLTLRTILVLQRAGIERVTLVGAPPPRDPRVHVEVAAAAEVAPVAVDDPVLLVGPGTVIDRVLVDGLQASVRHGDVVELARGGARVRVAPGRRIAMNGVPAVAPSRGLLEPAGLPDAALERALLRGLDNPRDGYLDGVCYRRVSRLLTPLLLETPLTPNAVTGIGVLAGVAGGLALALPGAFAVVACIALLVLSGALDCADGELARLRFHESRLGHVLDVVGDTLVHVALLAGLALRLAHAGDVPDRLQLWSVGLAVLGAFAAITWCEVAEERRQRVDCWENRVIDGALSPLTTRDWHVIPLAMAATGTLGWMVPIASVGAHVFWIATAVLCWRVLRRAPAA